MLPPQPKTKKIKLPRSLRRLSRKRLIKRKIPRRNLNLQSNKKKRKSL